MWIWIRQTAAAHLERTRFSSSMRGRRLGRMVARAANCCDKRTRGRAGTMEHVSYLVSLLIGLLFAVAPVAGLARRFAVSYPIALVILGLLCSVIPHVPRIPLPPAVVF